MQPDLPEGYYLDNVISLFDHVESLYADILDAPQLEFLHDFAALPVDAKKLFIRLSNRSHSLFRLSKLHYAEISSMARAVEALQTSGFIELDPGIEPKVRIGLFTKGELLAMRDDKTELKKLRRAALDSWLLEEASEAFFARLAQSDRLISLVKQDSYQLCQMLFFGNLNQSMTDFVLRDLGLNQYESYRIDTQNRPYGSAADIQQHWLLHQIDALLQVTEATDTASLKTCFEAVPGDISPESPWYRKGERIKYEVARQFERLEQLPLALKLYRRCRLPPSRERIARILHRQGKIDAAVKHCEAIIDRPLSDEESQFAQAFGKRLIKRHEIQRQTAFDPVSARHEPEIYDLELEKQASVELAVVDHFLAQNADHHCYFLENSLFNGVLGLLIWDAVFASLPGAFYNPFQYRPADFYTDDFRRKREQQLRKIWSSISSNADIWRKVSACWQSKQGLMNPLVNWQGLSLDIIELALQRIEFAHWMAILERIQLDLRHNRAGFPDLVWFPSGGGYQLVEVKGPGDTLQKNQQRWMQFFAGQGIPHALARVRWKPES